MKIYYGHEIFSLQSYGGISRYFYELYSGIKNKQNVQAEILNIITANEYLINEKCIHLNETRNVWLKRFMYFTNCVVSKSKTTFNTSDIYHETYYPHSIYINTNAKVVNTIHDMIPEKYGNASNKSFADLIERKKIAIKNSDYIICVSNNTKNDLLNLYPECEQKISVVYHGGELGRHLSKVNPYASNQPYILYVGSRGAYKNFSMLAKAYSSSEDINKNFKLIAFGATPFTKKEQEMLADYKITDKVEQLQGTDEQLIALYKGASVFVYPSIYEGFGIPILEAMRCGCPVISSNTSSLPEVGGAAVCYFDPLQVDELRDKLLSVLTDTGYRQQLITLGNTQKEQFSWDKCVNETYEIYKNLL